MFFCPSSLCANFFTASAGTCSSVSPWTISPEDGQGARKEKSSVPAGGEIETNPSISGRRIINCIEIFEVGGEVGILSYHGRDSGEAEYDTETKEQQNTAQLTDIDEAIHMVFFSSG